MAPQMRDAPKLNLMPTFVTPFVETQYENCESLNKELTELFLAREAEGDQYKNPYMTPGKVGLFESDFDLFKWPEECVQKLRLFCMTALAHTVAMLSDYTPQETRNLQIYNHTWFHVTPSGGYTTFHNHPMASWSGVYCVDPGTTPPDKLDSGVLRFQDPRQFGHMYMDAGNSRLKSPYMVASQNYRLRAGQLILFPSDLLHEVAPYFGEGVRITVAFNSWIKQNEQQ